MPELVTIIVRGGLDKPPPPPTGEKLTALTSGRLAPSERRLLLKRVGRRGISGFVRLAILKKLGKT